MDIFFFVNSILLGIGLAMDAFSVSMANGLNEPFMSRKKVFTISGVFASFQALMPMIGWLCVHTLLGYFNSFEKFIPVIALILLCYIGSKMIYDGIKNKNEVSEPIKIGVLSLIMQGIATSIDALSVGFTIANYNFILALTCALVIASVTFMICFVGVVLGKRFGTKLSGKAQFLGGAILIFIGLEIFIKSII